MGTTQTEEAEKIDTEIAVIGAGGAGLAAAATAAQMGARVSLIEKRRSPGGNSILAGGLFAAESSVQKKMDMNTTKDELFMKAMAYSHWKTNPRIVRSFIDKSADTIQWLEGKGVHFNALVPLIPNQEALTWHCPKYGGKEIIKSLIEECQKLGVQMLHQYRGKIILMDESGKVNGVLLERNGKEIGIGAEAVIIATGGYGANKKLLKKYYPHYTENMHLLGAPCKGDGLIMAIEAGGATEGLGLLHLHGPYYRGPAHIDALSREPDTIWINKDGERYTDETITFNPSECGNALERQKYGISYTLLDTQLIKNKIKEGIVGGTIHVEPGSKLTGIETKLQGEVVKDTVKISDTWHEIAEWIGVPPQVLNSTIEEYNAYCAQGCDLYFSKDNNYLKALKAPPYYAIKCYPSFLGTIGGIKINHFMEVLDLNGHSIPGLYAAGSDTGGWESDTYNYYLAGTAFGFAINSGRIAGEKAANMWITRIG